MRMLSPSQNLNSGTLRLVNLPGYVREAKLPPESARHLWLNKGALWLRVRLTCIRLAPPL